MPLSEAAALADPTADCQQPQHHPDPDTKTPTKTRRPPYKQLRHLASPADEESFAMLDNTHTKFNAQTPTGLYNTPPRKQTPKNSAGAWPVRHLLSQC